MGALRKPPYQPILTRGAIHTRAAMLSRKLAKCPFEVNNGQPHRETCEMDGASPGRLCHSRETPSAENMVGEMTPPSLPIKSLHKEDGTGANL